MINKRMNVLFNYPYRFTYYLIHPWKFFRHMVYNIRDAWQRINDGVSIGDSWDADTWVLLTFPRQLRRVADAETYPECEKFPDWISWHDWLYDLAYKMEQCLEENHDARNEYAAAYHAMLYEKEQDEAVIDAYLNRDLEILQENKEIIREVFNELSEYFFALWI